MQEKDEIQLGGEILLYRTEDGRTRVECRFEDDTIWLSQALMAELFNKDVRTVNEHIKNIYEEGEQPREATIRKFRIVRKEDMREFDKAVEQLPAKTPKKKSTSRKRH